MVDELTGACKGQRVIIGGLSPHVNELPRDFLKTGKVIGINKWPKIVGVEYTDYWIALDTGQVFKDSPYWKGFKEEYLDKMQCPKVMRYPRRETESHVPMDYTPYWFKPTPVENMTVNKWNGFLTYCSTTATAAINLAIIMGAKEVVLYGVDFLGNTRADGSPCIEWLRRDTNDSSGKKASSHVINVNRLLYYFSKHTKIYKLHKDSPLLAEYMEI